MSKNWYVIKILFCYLEFTYRDSILYHSLHEQVNEIKSENLLGTLTMRASWSFRCKG